MNDRVQVVLDGAGVMLAEAAEEERAMIATDRALSSLEQLGCTVLRAAERKRAETWRAGHAGLAPS